VIRKCFTQYKIEEVFLSFNGGKDCTVLLDITLNVLRQMYRTDDIAKLKIVYIRTTGPFREIEEFVKDIEEHYGVTLVVTEGELRGTLKRLLEEDERLKACLMGTRRTDPYSADLEFMQVCLLCRVKIVVTQGELRVTLKRLLEEDERLKACLMGTRRTDPYSADLEFMQ
ncbi:Molybdopterin-binding protein, partial [Operophtera brumata]